MIDCRVVLQIIQKLNLFIDNADSAIQRTRSNFNTNKTQLSNRNRAALDKLTSDYNNTKNSLNSRARVVLGEAQVIHRDILKLDSTLTAADKYYVKTKSRKEEELANTQSEKHCSDTDLFESLKSIRDQYQVLTARYSQDILPAIINGLNYIFSSKRKKDYEELIILKNTVESLIAEINQTLPELTQESVSGIDAKFRQDKQHLAERSAFAEQQLEQQYQADTETLAELICEQLDEILPDSILAELAASTVQYYDNLCKINVNSKNDVEGFVLGFFDYQLDVFVQSPVLSSLIKEKCSSILVDGQVLQFPMMYNKAQPLSLIVKNDGADNSIALEFAELAMIEFISRVPITLLSYAVIDPENRGNSIADFFDLKKKLPELFDEKIYFERDEILQKLNSLNEYIDQTQQNCIGSQYETIFDYEEANEEYQTPIKLLLIYDFPKGFDEQSLTALRNILRNGYKCGIYTLIYHDTINGITGYNNMSEALKLIDEMCMIIQQHGEELILSGLTVGFLELPQKQELATFFNKYLLIYEGIKNKGLAFPSYVKKLMDITDPTELKEHIDSIIHVLKQYDEAWNNVPITLDTFPSTVTLGTVEYPMDIFSDSPGYKDIQKTFSPKKSGVINMGAAELPLICDLKNLFNLFLHCPEANNKEMLSFTHQVMWSFFSALPVSKVNVSIFDCEHNGNSVTPFLDFKKRAPILFDNQIYTSQNEVSERLDKLNRSITELIQDKLKNKYTNILDYNIENPKRAEAVTLLLIYDFPKGFDSRSIDLLLNILKNGSKCGIYTVICYNPSVQYSRYENIEERLEDITKFCAIAEYRDRTYRLLPYNIPINIKPPMDSNEAEKYIDEYVEHYEVLKKQGLAFKDILPPPHELFTKTSAERLSIPFGIGDGDSIVDLTFGEGSSHHCMIAGATGGGKSTLLHTLIMSCLLHFDPSQLHLYLMDFKSGTEFKVYELQKLPHIQLIALDAMQEFGESILVELINEMTRRSDKLKESGTTKISDYVANTGDPMPRILVIMDEYQILFNDKTNRKVAGNCAELAHRIVTEGRSFGIHLLMASQTTKVLPDLTLSRGTVDQMRIRIGLKCDTDALFMFGDENERRAIDLMKGEQKGTGVITHDYTEAKMTGMRVVYCDPNTQKDYLGQISERYKEATPATKIFEGSRTTPLLDFFHQNQMGLSNTSSPDIYLGDLIKVAPPFLIKVDRRRKHNLLICGANDKMSENITNSYMLSALMNQNSKVYCIDGEYLVGDSASQDIYTVFEKFNNRFQVASDRNQIVIIVNEVYSAYTERKKGNSNQHIFVFIKSLQFIDIVRKMLADEYINESDFISQTPSSMDDNDNDPTGFGFIDDYGSEDNASVSISTKMLQLIDDGSGYGISFVISSSECQVIKETMQYGGGGPLLPKFPERIIFSLGDGDADYLIDNVSVSNLKDNIVYFTDGIKSTFQLKPYIMPSVDELDTFVKSLLGGDSE